MQGNLQQIQLPEVLQFISMGKSTGLLTIRDPHGVETRLMIRKGKIINSSALERQRRLGELLIHRGILKRNVLTQLLALQRTIESDKRLGEILVERDIVQESTLREVLRLQLEEEIWNLFGLEAGEFKFEQVDDASLGEAAVQIDIEPLLLEGTRRQDEWRKILKLLPSDRLVIGVRDTRSTSMVDKARLTPSEWKVLAQINGRFCIRGIVNRSGMGRFEVYRIIYDFLRQGVVYVKEEKPKEAAPAAAEETRVSADVEAGKGVGGLLSRLTGGGRREDRSKPLRFVSPIGALAHFINRFAEQLLATREVRNSPEDRELMDVVWNDLLVNYTKADLVKVARNKVQPEELETYLRLFEFSEATQDCYEESMEALLQLLDTMYRVFSSKIGERAVTKMVRDLLDEIAPRASYDVGGEFKLGDRIMGLLQLAA